MPRAELGQASAATLGDVLRDQVCSQWRILSEVHVMDSRASLCQGHQPLTSEMTSATRCRAEGLARGTMLLHWFCLPWTLKLDQTFSSKTLDRPKFCKSQHFWSGKLGYFHEPFGSTKAGPPRRVVARHTALNGALGKSFSLHPVTRAQSPFLARTLWKIPRT